jgi:hypothetical protein
MDCFDKCHPELLPVPIRFTVGTAKDLAVWMTGEKDLGGVSGERFFGCASE